MAIIDYGHWLTRPMDFDPDKWFGFIYRITNNTNGKEYIGKKQFHSYTRKKIKGRKNRKKIVKLSKWYEYTGSSKKVNTDIEALGIENFSFQIESLHKSRGSLYYREVEVQVKENVLKEKLDNGNRKYYNGHIGAIKFLPPEECAEETKAKISNTMLRNGTTAGKNNPRYGKSPHEYLSEEEKIALKLKTRRPGKLNGMYGRPSYYKMTEKEKQQWKDNISNTMKGVPKSEITKERMRKPKGPQRIVACPHCQKEGGVSNMTRYHFDACKFK